VIRVLEWEAEYMHDDLNDPIHEVLRASFEDGHSNRSSPEIIDKLCRHTCGKKLASVCPSARISKKSETVYKLRCKHYIHVEFERLV
jgi:hypothetical protein